ncbi:site-specific recombinase XerD [Lutibacter oceani]|uniref:Site-specific recombinase XerD n=1 Tax=Lutibacter oceani TaxID=1853311 RepID=A0A3D9RQR3_9FLAO|nr:site-specific integrase [Lutibacter oceani]REE82137.1 site-specific recombinase XerD [Lutibacter oceani]
MDFRISLYLDKRKSKKNTPNLFPVKLQLYSVITKKQKFFGTGIDLSKDDFEDIFNSDKSVRGKKNEIKVFLQNILSRANKVAMDLSPFSFESFEKKMFRRKGASINIQYHYNNKIDVLTKNDQISTASNYRLSLKSLNNFLIAKSKGNIKNLTFYDITTDWLNKYESYMIKDVDKSRTTVSMYLRALRTIFNDAINENEIKRETYPFGKGKGKYQIPTSTGTKKALSREQLKILFNANTITPEEERAKDFWFFSYACSGMNIKDIALLKYKNIDDGNIRYYRAKTINTKKGNLKEINVPLNDYARGVILKYGNEHKNPDQVIFPILLNEDDALKQRRKVKNFTSLINLHFNKVAKREGFEFKISSYWARHSFATVSIQKGASMEFISEALNHSSLSVTKNYFAGFEDKDKKEFADKLMDF